MTWTTQPRFKQAGLAMITKPIPHCTDLSLVFLHGVGLRAEAWGAQIAAFAGRHSILAFDMAGHGESAAFDAPVHTLDAFLEPIIRALDAEACTPAMIIGHSMGAMLALRLAVKRPDLVSAVVALNAVYRRSEDAKTAIMARLDALKDDQPLDPNPVLARWFSNKTTPEAIACQSWLAQMDPKAYHAAYHIFAKTDGLSDADLSCVTCPVLFMTGALDPNSTPAMSEAMAKATPIGQSLVLAGAAHMMPMTHSDAVNRAIATLVDGASAIERI
ncbi:MAG TPA: alpha/beta hydrolase [Rhodobacter sp.]|nr:alpha/beta hydrolase [Rhodobacter sp.]